MRAVIHGIDVITLEPESDADRAILAHWEHRTQDGRRIAANCSSRSLQITQLTLTLFEARAPLRMEGEIGD